MEEEILQKYLLAGKIASEVREESKKIVEPGIKLLKLAEKIETLIKEKGGLPAFPVNISINDIAAHYTPTNIDEKTIKESDVIKIDIGVHVDGYIGDTAFTIAFDDKYNDLIRASEEALKNAIELCKPGTLLSNISTTIEETIKSFGFKPISNLTGHGLERYNLHAEPQILNVKFSSNYRLKENQIIAIEPFATNGAGLVKESGDVFIFMLVNKLPVRNFDARKIVDFAEQYNGLPFTERWLMTNEAKSFGIPDSLFKIRIALKELRERGIIYDYPVLKDAKFGLVSQSEHTIIVKDEPIVTTK
ncbi:MAG: type II methionyl aminopeptidase [Candidatus Aenigmatarchaeota archaeon]